MELYINNKLMHEGKLNSDEDIIADLSVIPRHEHNIDVKITCIKGTVSVGTVDTNFCQDINPVLPLVYKQAVYQKRLADEETKIINPYVYYDNFNEYSTALTKDLLRDERFNITVNNTAIDITATPKGYDSYAGWHYILNEGDTITFKLNLFRPIDPLGFIIEQQVGDEYFDEFLPPSF